MGYSSQKFHRERKERPWKINPIWRGIGCFLLILVLLMSWYGAALFLRTNTTIELPWELTKIVEIPFSHIAALDKVILDINHYFQASGFVFGQVFFTVIFAIIGFGILSVLYAFLYKIAGPPRYGPFDVPPDRIK